MSPEGLFSSLFSVSLVFSLEQNSKKCHFPSYFPHPIFQLLCFHPDQTYPKSRQLISRYCREDVNYLGLDYNWNYIQIYKSNILLFDVLKKKGEILTYCSDHSCWYVRLFASGECIGFVHLLFIWNSGSDLIHLFMYIHRLL